MTLGQRIMAIRMSALLSQEAFGEKLGVSRQTVSKWETDMCFPDIKKIVLLCKTFSVSADSVLLDGITSFDTKVNEFNCGIYRSLDSEIVETEKYALIFTSDENGNVMTVKLYVGFGENKLLRAVCYRNNYTQKTLYAYETDDGVICSNDCEIEMVINTKYDAEQKKVMKRLETFRVDRRGEVLPKVSEVGISKAFLSWRMCSRFNVSQEKLFFSLCTDKTEYIMQIEKEDLNIYCGASNNIVFDLGLYCAGQYFRIRNYKDNSESFCKSGCDFSKDPRKNTVPTDSCEIGCSVNVDGGMVMKVKRYNDEEIVLYGCNGDEYKYCRNDIRSESYTL